MSRMSKTAAVPTMENARASTGLFNNQGYKSTSTIAFRGQDKGPKDTLGANPNQTNVEEEYISNL